MTLRRGNTVTINNDLGHVLRLTRWDDDHLSIEIVDDGEDYPNILRFEANFGIAGHLDDLRAMFAGEVEA